MDSELTYMESHHGELRVHEIEKLNRATLCYALTHWPKR